MNDAIFESITQEDYLLIEYDLFMGDMRQICSFVIDEEKELKELKNILLQIKKSDINVSAYVRTYGVDTRSDGNLFIYGDNIWLDTNITIDELNHIFSQYDEENNPLRGIVPYSISFPEEELVDGLKYVFHNNGRIEDFSQFKLENKLANIKSIYWD
jgi:hypothetical protein